MSEKTVSGDIPKRASIFPKKKDVTSKMIAHICMIMMKNIHQDKINHAVAVVVTKHNNEIMVIQEELKKLKDTIETMKQKMCVLEKDGQEVLKNNSIEIQEEYTP